MADTTKPINFNISFHAGSIIRILWIAAAILLAASIAVNTLGGVTGDYRIHGVVPLFDLDSERNIPTAASMLLILFASLLLGLVAYIRHQTKESDIRYWTLLSAGFLYMALDEGLCVHERLINPCRTLLGGGNLGVLHFAWVLPGILVVAIVGISFLKFTLSLPASTKRNFLIAAFLYLGGAIGFELIGGFLSESYSENSFIYRLSTTVEEGLEIVGMIWFIRALLQYLSKIYPGKSIHLEFK